MYINKEAHSVRDIVIGNGIGYPSSNPGQG